MTSRLLWLSTPNFLPRHPGNCRPRLTLISLVCMALNLDIVLFKVNALNFIGHCLVWTRSSPTGMGRLGPRPGNGSSSWKGWQDSVPWGLRRVVGTSRPRSHPRREENVCAINEKRSLPSPFIDHVCLFSDAPKNIQMSPWWAQLGSSFGYLKSQPLSGKHAGGNCSRKSNESRYSEFLVILQPLLIMLSLERR